MHYTGVILLEIIIITINWISILYTSLLHYSYSLFIGYGSFGNESSNSVCVTCVDNNAVYAIEKDIIKRYNQ